MNNTNTLLVEKNVLQMKNFTGLKYIVTFCFLPAGVVIMNGEADERPFRFQASVKEDGFIDNKEITERLIQRGLLGENNYFLHEGSFYESEPHRMWF